MKARWLSELDERLVDPYANDGTGLWRLLAQFGVYSAVLGREVWAPEGFTHDHGTVPRLPVIYANFGNRYHRPTVIHDYLCRYRICSREKADLVFLEFMRLQNDEEIEWMREQGIDDDEIADRKAALEGRAQMMYAAVVLYSKTGAWKTDIDATGFDPLG